MFLKPFMVHSHTGANKCFLLLLSINYFCTTYQEVLFLELKVSCHSVTQISNSWQQRNCCLSLSDSKKPLEPNLFVSCKVSHLMAVKMDDNRLLTPALLPIWHPPPPILDAACWSSRKLAQAKEKRVRELNYFFQHVKQVSKLLIDRKEQWEGVELLHLALNCHGTRLAVSWNLIPKYCGYFLLDCLLYEVNTDVSSHLLIEITLSCFSQPSTFSFITKQLLQRGLLL